MSRIAAVAFVVSIAACTSGARLQRTKTPATANASASSSVPPLKAAPSSSNEPNETGTVAPDVEKAARWTWTTIGCQVGAAWSEALGALGEERVMSALRRCRTIATEILRAKLSDETALTNVREADPATVDRIVAAIEKAGGKLGPLVRASAEASREALLSRRAAEKLRKGASLESVEAQLAAKDALAKLWARKEAEALVIALVIAADHVETAHGLPAKAKVSVARPAFEVVFGVAPASDDWAAYIAAVAKKAGHPGTDENSSFRGVVAAFADQFELQMKKLDPGEPKEVSGGCMRRLRKELADAKP